MYVEHKYFDQEIKRDVYQFGGAALNEACAEIILSGEQMPVTPQQLQQLNDKIKRDEPKHIGMGKFFIGLFLFFSPLIVICLMVKLNPSNSQVLFRQYGLLITIICYTIFAMYIIYSCISGTKRTKKYMEKRWTEINHYGITAFKHHVEHTYFMETRDPSYVCGYICYSFKGIFISDVSCYRSWSGQNAAQKIIKAEEQKSQYLDAEENITLAVVNMKNKQYVFITRPHIGNEELMNG